MKNSVLDPRRIYTVKEFESNLAIKLRTQFERIYSNPRKSNSKRAIWDPWFIQDQFNSLRTQPDQLWSTATSNTLHQALKKFGEENLGCGVPTKPWVSLYLKNHFQHFHTDATHGPWAYVWSLSTHPLFQSQGEGSTYLFETELNLNSVMSSFEKPQLCPSIAPLFSQLLLFDPRIPHGVEAVESNLMDPRDGRLVVHGWFTFPLWQDLTAEASVIHSMFLDLLPEASRDWSGTLILELDFTKSKNPKMIVKTHTVLNARDLGFWLNACMEAIQKQKYKTRGDLRLPFIFDQAPSKEK